MEILIEGKTKLIESLDDKSLVRIRTKDSLTANDAAIQADLPIAQDKTSQTIHVFALLKREGIPVAYKSRNDETSFIADKCRMIPIECVIRRRPYGSYIKREPQASSSDLFDPVKTEFFHKYAIVKDEMIFEDKARELYLRNGEWTETVYTDPLIEPYDNTWLLYPPKQPRHQMQPLMDIIPVVDPVTLEYIRNSLMIPCFETIEKAWKKVNVDLIDMKIEVGINSNKEIVIADVIDNDSWRIWPHGNPKQQLDKQSFRDGENLTDVQRKYAIVTEYTSKF
tara:strand:- start:3006 stop:3848 length:843 start_codon:yes stop_codon:yes gene_type:complete